MLTNVVKSEKISHFFRSIMFFDLDQADSATFSIDLVPLSSFSSCSLWLIEPDKALWDTFSYQVWDQGRVGPDHFYALLIDPNKITMDDVYNAEKANRFYNLILVTKVNAKYCISVEGWLANYSSTQVVILHFEYIT